jgi:hypothetical protein
MIGLLRDARWLTWLLVLFYPAGVSAGEADGQSTVLGLWRWVEDALTWLKSIGMDRGRLVQLWLLFVLIGLFIIMRIKPRA